jgi:arsenate reductase
MTLSWAIADRAGASEALEAAGLPADDLGDPAVSLYAFSEDGRPVGFGGLECHGADVLIRSIAVLPSDQGRGVGRSVVAALLRIAEDVGAERAYLLTTSASSYFGRLGFTPIDRVAAPHAIRETRQMTGLCPSTAVLMSRSVR